MPEILPNPAFQLAPCSSTNPLMQLQASPTAPTLNYSMPHSTTYSAVSFAELPIDPTWYLGTLSPPARDRWADAKAIIDSYASGVTTPHPGMTNRQTGAFDALAFEHDLIVHADAPQGRANFVNHAGVLDAQATFRTAQINTINAITSSPPSEPLVGNQVSTGTSPGYGQATNREVLARILAMTDPDNSDTASNVFLPVAYTRFSGRPDYIAQSKPNVDGVPTSDPHLSLVFHFKFASYLGDYGAAETLNTFTLLPGESTTISVRHYLATEDTRQASQSILDSFSQSCADNLQDSIQNESQFATSLSQSDEMQKTGSWNAGGSASLNLGFFSIGGGGGGGGTSATSSALNENLSSQVQTLQNCVTNQTQQADAARQIDVNTDSTSRSDVEDEEVITRQLQNINKSRTLNFVFRQLVQEYVTLTWVDDISLVYYDGFPDNKKSCKIGQMDGMLRQLFKPGTGGLTFVRNMIMDAVNSLIDYQENTTSFFTTLPATTLDHNYDSTGTITNVTRFRKKKLIRNGDGTYTNEWGTSGQYGAINANGIIVDATSRIIRTPGVIVDSILGQGNALDCYNSRLQDIAAQSAYLDVLRKQQALEVIENQTAPADAQYFSRVWYGCCDVTQGNCGCGGSGTGGSGSGSGSGSGGPTQG